MHLQHLIAIAGLSGLASGAVVPSGLETRSDDPGFVYEQAYRIRIAKNSEFPDFTDRDYDRILPGLPDSDSQLSTWWFGYQSAGTRFTNIAVAQLWPSAVYYEQVYHSEFSSTWKAYTDHEKFFRLSFKAQGLTEFDPDYPQEHNVFVNRDDTDLALGAPAPTHPPEVWGPAPGTYLVCRREFQHREVLAVRFAYSVLNETRTGNIPRACVPVKLESRCAQLEPLLFNKTWNHDEIITTPCVKDAFSWGKKAVRGPAPVALDYTKPAAMARELHRETKEN